MVALNLDRFAGYRGMSFAASPTVTCSKGDVMRRVFKVAVATALTIALPALAAAQGRQTAPVPPQNERASFNDQENSWIATGFLGSNFGARADESSVQFGGQLAYLYRGVFGGEVLA